MHSTAHPGNRDGLSWQEISLRLRNPFRVAYGVSEARTATWLRLAGDEGWGEGTIPPYYEVAPSAMVAFWEAAARRTEAWPDDPAAIPGWIGEDGPAPARSALDLALHDRIGRQRGQPLYRLLGLPPPSPLPTAFTISIDAPDVMARQAAQMVSYPILKVKLGSDDDEAGLAAVRAARPDATLFVDANAGWTAEEAIERLKALMPYRPALIEQPVPKDDFEGMGRVQASTDVPIVADESVRTLS